MRWFLLLSLLMALGVACGASGSSDSDSEKNIDSTLAPETDPVSIATPQPTNAPATTVTQGAPDLSLSAVTKEHLPSMVLAQSEVSEEFPGLQLDLDDSGFQDEDDAADSTADPEDTGVDLLARGRLDGYVALFSNLSEPLVEEGVFALSSGVELFGNAQSARDFLSQELEDIQRLVDLPEEGVAQYQRLADPDLGDSSAAIRISGRADDQVFFAHIVNWTRGPLAATVGVASFDDTDRSASTLRLAQVLDRTIDAVLAGQVDATGSISEEGLESTATSEGDMDSTTTTPSGLQFKDLTVGQGEAAREGATAVVHYTGWLMDGTKFDSSVDRGTPFEFVIGQGRVIKGWDEGVLTMNVGGKRELIIPPDLGYGDRGAGNVIPPGATLRFEVELLELR